MALCCKQHGGSLQLPYHAARQSVSRPCVPRGGSFVCRYRASGDGQHKDQQYLLYTSEDPTHGGISPESHSVLLCLMEKKVPFREVKVRDITAFGVTRSRSETVQSAIDDPPALDMR